jgi:hypothetical protein
LILNTSAMLEGNIFDGAGASSSVAVSARFLDPINGLDVDLGGGALASAGANTFCNLDKDLVLLDLTPTGILNTFSAANNNWDSLDVNDEVIQDDEEPNIDDGDPDVPDLPNPDYALGNIQLSSNTLAALPNGIDASGAADAVCTPAP